MNNYQLRDRCIIIKVKDILSQESLTAKDIAMALNMSKHTKKDIFNEYGISIIKHQCGWSTIYTFKPFEFILGVMSKHDIFKDRDREWFRSHESHLYNKAIELFVKDVRSSTGIPFTAFEALFLRDKGYVYQLDPICGDLLVKIPFDFKVTGSIIDRLDDMSGQFS